MVYPVSKTNTVGTSLVMTFEHNGYHYKHQKLSLTSLSLVMNQWNKVTFDYLTPEVRNKKDKLKVYLEHLNEEELLIDDLKVEIFNSK